MGTTEKDHDRRRERTNKEDCHEKVQRQAQRLREKPRQDLILARRRDWTFTRLRHGRIRRRQEAALWLVGEALPRMEHVT
jgi:hypothetical protein